MTELNFLLGLANGTMQSPVDQRACLHLQVLSNWKDILKSITSFFNLEFWSKDTITNFLVKELLENENKFSIKLQLLAKFHFPLQKRNS